MKAMPTKLWWRFNSNKKFTESDSVYMHFAYTFCLGKKAKTLDTEHYLERIKSIEHEKNIYHLNHRIGRHSLGLFELAEYCIAAGYPLQKVPFPKWKKMLSESEENALTPLFSYF